MRATSAPGKPFGQYLYFKSGEIELICEDALRASGCLPTEPRPIEIDWFIEKHFGCRIVYEDLGLDVLGFTVFDGSGAVAEIGVAPSLDDGSPTGNRRARSTLAHEAGHGLLHGALFTQKVEPHPLLTGHYEPERRRILCRSADMRTRPLGYDGKWWEWQANRAIAGLLLPNDLVHQTAEPFTRPSALLGIADLPDAHRTQAQQAVAETFDVNPIVAEIRLSELYPQDGQRLL